jgi:hypothetical protein
LTKVTPLENFRFTIYDFYLVTARGSAAADSGKTRSNNQSVGWQNTSRIPAPKVVGCIPVLGALLHRNAYSLTGKRNSFKT